MNQTHFLQTGGFPLDLNVLDRMQKAYELFNKLGYMVGQFGIIEGCQTIGTTVTNGTVFIQGEVFEFVGGELSDTVIIVEEPINGEFEGGAVKTIHTRRYVTFGSGVTTYAWTLFKTFIPLVELQEALDSKASQNTVSVMQGQIDNLITAIATIPKIRIISGATAVANFTNGMLQTDFTKNNYEILPPAGYSMSNLAGFMPSISEINFGGNVDGNDTLWCNYQITSEKIRVVCSNSESRSAAKINYIAIWIKF